MQSDDVIWEIIDKGHCSFKSKTTTQAFCRNPHNVTGLCNRSSCPLANSRYATVIEEKGVCYLMMKSVERAHTPKTMWEKVKLSRGFAGALAQIDTHLQFWPEALIMKNKQRLTKITQYLIRCRRLAKEVRPTLVTMPARLEKREARREVKAQVAARLEASIEAELLSRLRSGTYSDIYNFPTKQFAKVLRAEGAADADSDEERADAGGEEGEEEEEEGAEEEEDVQFVEGYEDLDEEAEEAAAGGGDVEDAGGAAFRRAPGREWGAGRGGGRGAAAAAGKRGREVEVEREEERETGRGRR